MPFQFARAAMSIASSRTNACLTFRAARVFLMLELVKRYHGRRTGIRAAFPSMATRSLRAGQKTLYRWHGDTSQREKNA
jgi:hypothetical protein